MTEPKFQEPVADNTEAAEREAEQAEREADSADATDED